MYVCIVYMLLLRLDYYCAAAAAAADEDSTFPLFSILLF